MLSDLDSLVLTLIILSVMGILGVCDGRNRVRRVKEGKERGVPQSPTFFDWLFYSRIDQ